MRMKPLKRGSHIRVIAPSLSMGILSKEIIAESLNRFADMGFTVSFGKNAFEIDEFDSSSVDSRIKDLHDAFIDDKVDGIITAIGGYNVNQLLPYINFDLIKKNPKFFCGYSDITILLNAFYHKALLSTVYGPHFSTFGQKFIEEYEIDSFLQSAHGKSFVINPAKTWSNDAWYTDQNNRNFLKNDGYWILQKGNASGICVGGHLGSLLLLAGTTFMPSIKDKILIIEEDADPANIKEFDRRLESLLQHRDADSIKGILIGRFEKSYGMSREILEKIIRSKKINSLIPIVANIDFGHTEPHCSIPIGGTLLINVSSKNVRFVVKEWM